MSCPLHRLLWGGGWHRACARSGGLCSHSRCWRGSGQRCGSLGRNNVLIKSHVGCKAQSGDRCKKKKIVAVGRALSDHVFAYHGDGSMSTGLCSPPLRTSSAGTSPPQAKRRGSWSGRQIARDERKKRQREGPPLHLRALHFPPAPSWRYSRVLWVSPVSLSTLGAQPKNQGTQRSQCLLLRSPPKAGPQLPLPPWVK